MNFRIFYFLLSFELSKAFRSKVFWLSLAGFSMIPLVGSLFVMIVKNPAISEGSPLLQAKVNLAGFAPTWPAFLGFFNMAMGGAGIIFYGFITSWVFGREYSDKTMKDLLVLPLSTGAMVAAKYICVFTWGMILAFWIYFLGTSLGSLAGLSGWEDCIFEGMCLKFLYLAFLNLIVSTPVAMFASWGRGFMAPLGFVFLSMAIGQIMATLGFGNYSPWSVPGLYSGAGGEAKSHLETISFVVVYITGTAGVAATWLFWKKADQ